MSLDYELKNIKNFEQLCFEMGKNDDDPDGPLIKHMHPVTYTLVWMSIQGQYHEITEKNYQQVFKRIYLMEQVFGVWNRRYKRKDEDASSNIIDIPITLKDVRDHIGLKTNVPFEKEPVFRKYVVDRIFSEQYRDADRIIKEAQNGN